MPTFVIEHLEPEVYGWCIIEYQFISEKVGKNNLIIANVRKKDPPKLKELGSIKKQSVAGLKLGNVCLLDSNAGKTLSSEDSGKFKYFLFGGILGDNPPKGRTKGLIRKLSQNKIKFEARNLGREQMPTDTAVYAAKKILEGAKLGDLKFKEGIEIEIKGGESVILPYRYILENNKPVISGRLVDYLKNKKHF